jgi:hypothetical protein
MNATLLKGLVALLPTGMLLFGSIVVFSKHRSGASFLQMVGAGGLILVVLTHICEGLHVLSWMGWGAKHSPGHYLDLSSAVLGLIFFPVGYLGMSLRGSRESRL